MQLKTASMLHLQSLRNAVSRCCCLDIRTKRTPGTLTLVAPSSIHGESLGVSSGPAAAASANHRSKLPLFGSNLLTAAKKCSQTYRIVLYNSVLSSRAADCAARQRRRQQRQWRLWAHQRR